LRLGNRVANATYEANISTNIERASDNSTRHIPFLIHYCLDIIVLITHFI